MASYKGHIAGGAIAGAAFCSILLFVPVVQLAEYAKLLNDWQPIAAIIVISILFALFPDIDTKSKGQGIFYWTIFLIDILLIWGGYFQAAAYLGLVATLPLLSKHRGWTHAKITAFLIPLPLVVVPYLYDEKLLAIGAVYYGAAVAGYLSHLLFDGLIWSIFRVRW